MELRHLRYFVAVAEESNFSRAARRLFLSQPSLSAQIKDLEMELGVQLLARSNRGVALTTAGSVFLEEVRTTLTRLDHACHQAQLADRGEIGSLSVGFVSLADFGILPPALLKFRSDFPSVQVQLHELTTDAQIVELRSGNLDLGIALAPVEEPDLQFENILEEELVLALPAPYGGPQLSSRGKLNLDSFSKESFIIPPREIAPGLYDLSISLCRASGFSPQITQHARQMQTVISLVSCGMGCALVPASVRNLQRPGVQYRQLAGPVATVKLGLLQLKQEQSTLQQNFAAALKASAGEL